MLILAGLLNSLSWADSGLVCPDTAQIDFSWTIDSDTLTVVIDNNSGIPLSALFYTDYTLVPITLLNCIIDGVSTVPLATEVTSGSVYPGEITTRYIFTTVTDSIVLKYYPFSYKFSFVTGNSFPIFGATRFVGPPNNVLWVE